MYRFPVGFFMNFNPYSNVVAYARITFSYREYILMSCIYLCLKVLQIATHTIMVYDSLGKCNTNEVDQVKEWLSLQSSHVWKEIDATLSVSCFKCS